MIQYALSRTTLCDRGSAFTPSSHFPEPNHARAYPICLSGYRRTLYAVDASDRPGDWLGVHRRFHIHGYRSRRLLGTRRRRRKGNSRGQQAREQEQGDGRVHGRHDVEGRTRRMLESRRYICSWRCSGARHAGAGASPRTTSRDARCASARSSGRGSRTHTANGPRPGHHDLA